ncbi:uncharacterized protein LOC106169016 [Lingula anatina]|uniref:Uncharacterized protein LOC106169016 n=1 Tax=Lingula anatina TaxID=7574 RepID=A0A1S3J1Q4_LINAN|nr:uncharacterized protein LOC106169016 [Lingula anatina]XP_013403754.1 uncharacterized protein LOC106169016 [Lingula anatina]|eukprot:XP_013403753.1 uncharacterized protein LOC106169016 [Lingula anatina]
MFRIRDRRHLMPAASLFRTLSSKVGKPQYVAPELPDYNTDVNIHQHKLKRPDRPPPSWTGLQGLKERTQGSLIPETLKEMQEDKQFQITAEQLKKFGQAKLTRDERKKRQRALDQLGVPSFLEYWQEQQLSNGVLDTEVERDLKKDEIEIMQLNIGIYCNQACNHCHVESSPKRKEMMTREVADKCLDIMAHSPSVTTVDITGGAPELCSEFRHLVKGVRKLDREIIDRCNLTVLQEPGQEDLPEFLAENGVHIIASLPCYSAKNVNMQRGKGVFDRSIQALLTLNQVGFGKPGSNLKLDLVYNPLGAFLPPKQSELEEKYREELLDTFGIEFTSLFTMTNMPIKRFVDFLYRRNELQEYMDLLVRNYNIATMDNLMCRNTLNVKWNGDLFDCDFNQQLELGIVPKEKEPKVGKTTPLTVWDIHSIGELKGSRIWFDNHCYGCSAGMGSS